MLKWRLRVGVGNRTASCRRRGVPLTMIEWDGSTAGGLIIQPTRPFRDTRRKVMLRATLLAALLTAAIPVTALAQTADELKNDEKTPGDVLVYGMGYSGNRYSPLT